MEVSTPFTWSFRSTLAAFMIVAVIGHRLSLSLMRNPAAAIEGSVLAVAAEKDLIVLKKVESGLSAEDLKSLRLVEEAWEDIEEGRYGVLSKEAFFKELKEW